MGIFCDCNELKAEIKLLKEEIRQNNCTHDPFQENTVNLVYDPHKLELRCWPCGKVLGKFDSEKEFYFSKSNMLVEYADFLRSKWDK